MKEYVVQWVEVTRVEASVMASSEEEALAKIKKMDQEELDEIASFDNGGMSDIYVQEV
jgi:hypothetical protein